MIPTPRTDREEYITKTPDVGFRVVNPALCRMHERAAFVAMESLAMIACMSLKTHNAERLQTEAREALVAAQRELIEPGAPK